MLYIIRQPKSYRYQNETGMHTASEYRCYLKYFESPRKRQFGDKESASGLSPGQATPTRHRPTETSTNRKLRLSIRNSKSAGIRNVKQPLLESGPKTHRTTMRIRSHSAKTRNIVHGVTGADADVEKVDGRRHTMTPDPRIFESSPRPLSHRLLLQQQQQQQQQQKCKNSKVTPTNSVMRIIADSSVQLHETIAEEQSPLRIPTSGEKGNTDELTRDGHTSDVVTGSNTGNSDMVIVNGTDRVCDNDGILGDGVSNFQRPASGKSLSNDSSGKIAGENSVSTKRLDTDDDMHARDDTVGEVGHYTSNSLSSFLSSSPYASDNEVSGLREMQDNVSREFALSARSDKEETTKSTRQTFASLSLDEPGAGSEVLPHNAPGNAAEDDDVIGVSEDMNNYTPRLIGIDGLVEQTKTAALSEHSDAELKQGDAPRYTLGTRVAIPIDVVTEGGEYEYRQTARTALTSRRRSYRYSSDSSSSSSIPGSTFFSGVDSGVDGGAMQGNNSRRRDKHYRPHRRKHLQPTSPSTTIKAEMAHPNKKHDSHSRRSLSTTSESTASRQSNLETPDISSSDDDNFTRNNQKYNGSDRAFSECNASIRPASLSHASFTHASLGRASLNNNSLGHASLGQESSQQSSSDYISSRETSSLKHTSGNASSNYDVNEDGYGDDDEEIDDEEDDDEEDDDEEDGSLWVRGVSDSGSSLSDEYNIRAEHYTSRHDLYDSQHAPIAATANTLSSAGSHHSSDDDLAEYDIPCANDIDSKGYAMFNDSEYG